MKSVNGWRPAPGTVLGTIAIFISLGGVSYGVATGSITSSAIKNNTIRSGDVRNNTLLGKDIRNSTILGKDIRNSTLTGSDVRNNRLTGSDVLESSLATVPSANTANRASFADAVSGFVHTSPVTQNYGGPDKDLFRLNGFRVYLHCDMAGPDGGTAVYVQNVSAGENAAADGEEATEHGIQENDDLDPGESFLVNGTASGAPNVDESGAFAAYGTQGALSGVVSVAGEIPATGFNCAANGYGVG
jgi:hypothetical protein